MALPSLRRAYPLDTQADQRVRAPAAPASTGGTILTKRITVPISEDIDKIRDRLERDTGVKMTYTQVFNFLIHFYVQRASEPKSRWRSME